jgi:hypothetical protein
VKQLHHNENGYRDVLKEIFLSESNLIVLDCEKKILEEVLKQCQQVGGGDRKERKVMSSPGWAHQPGLLLLPDQSGRPHSQPG